MRNAKTEIMTEDMNLTTSYQTVDFPASLGAVYQHGGQVVLTFLRTSGTSITFIVDEYFSALTGWVPRTEKSGSSLNLMEITCTEAAFAYAFPTVAEKIRVRVKAASTDEDLDLYLTVGEIV